MAVRQGLQPADADDLVQEVFVAIARSVSQWLERPDRGRFRAWLLRIARNTAVNFLTRPSHRPLATGGDEAARMLAEVPAPESTLSSQFDLEYRREVFRWAAEQVREAVAEATWQAFWLTHVEGRSISDAAEQLGISVGAVYVARSRVMNRLKQLVKEFGVMK
jgi:RNA polymerase sigma-70 factor (ECF subfamily)